MQKIPGIGDIPILGYMLKSKASKRDQTELVVMITPEILPNNSPGVTPSLPMYPDTFMPPLSDLKKSYPAPAPGFTEPSRSQAANPAAAPVADSRTEIERAQDRALAALDGKRPEPPAAAVAAAPATESPVVAPPVAAQAPAAQATEQAAAQVTEQAAAQATEQAAAQATDPASAVSQQADADVAELSKEHRQLEKAAREQAERDAKAADKARKEEEKRAAAAQAKQNELDREQAKKDAKAAKVQAEKGDEAAKLQAKAVKEAEATAQRQMLDARREAEREAERQRAIDSAAERLRTAEAEYQAELERRTQR
jgi:Bacterial type II and III secretion system protein